MRSAVTTTLVLGLAVGLAACGGTAAPPPATPAAAAAMAGGSGQISPGEQDLPPAPRPAAEPLRACTTHGSSPVGVPPAEYDKRNGAATHELARVVSSKDNPVETCGLDAETAWIGAATCADGSTPARGQAERVRAGNVGRGGRCGSIVDQYKIPCPERTYDVFVDAYICAQPVR